MFFVVTFLEAVWYPYTPMNLAQVLRTMPLEVLQLVDSVAIFRAVQAESVPRANPCKCFAPLSNKKGVTVNVGSRDIILGGVRG